MRILVVGSGGREHALCWKIAASPLTDTLYCAPGNAGIAAVAECVPIGAEDIEKLTEFAVAQTIDLVVVGPEEPLCAGLADRLGEAGIAVFGPGGAGARLEGSKLYSKEFLTRHRIPTASWRRFDRSGAAKAYLEGCAQWPQVIKADGLAAGKGVSVVHSPREGWGVVDGLMEERRP